MRISIVTMPKTQKKFYITIFLLLLAYLAVSVTADFISPTEVPVVGGLPLTGKTVVLDPGHGGYDPGVWRNDVEEKTVTLDIALFLRDYLQAAGARVVMTRESDRDLLVMPTAGPKKKQDMRNRLAVIRNADPDVLISVHANAIGAARWRGAQVFYKIDHEESKAMAELMQQELARVLENTERESKPGNYLILNEMDIPAVLVETGFISNPTEAALLTDPDYQSKVAWSVYTGLLRHLDVQQPPS